MPSNLEHKARRKRQTRLTFHPIDPDNTTKSSSPSEKRNHLSPANVRYRLSPTMNPSQSKPGGAKSAADAFKISDNDDEDNLPNPTPTRRGARGKLRGNMRGGRTSRSTALEEGPGYDMPDSTSSSDEDILAVPRKKMTAIRGRLCAPRLSRADSQRQKKPITPSDNSNDDLVLSPRSSQPQSLYRPSKKPVADDTDSDDQPPVPSSVPRRPRNPIIVEDDSDELSVQPKPKKLPTPATKGKTVIDLEDDSDLDLRLPVKRRQRQAVQKDDDSEDSDELPLVSPLKRRKSAVESDSSDIAPSPSKRRRPTRPVEDDEDSDSSDSDLPALKKVASGSRRARAVTSKNLTTPSRFTRKSLPRKSHRTAREKAAELLKRKRAGEKIDKVTDSSSDGDEVEPPLYDSDTDQEVLRRFDDEEFSPEPAERRASESRQRPNVNQHRSNTGGDEDDSDFVVEDDELIGVPLSSLGIPLQYTHHAHKPLKEHFKDCVEWLVHNKLDPSFPNRDDPIYKQAFIKVDFEAQGYAKSKFISSQWTSDFTKALNARPDLIKRPLCDGEGYTVDGVPKCDACNHRSHVPSVAISFRGKPYVKETLLEVPNESDSDSDSDSHDDSGSEDEDEDRSAIDEHDNDIKPASTVWFAGRDCADKATYAHMLVHWKYALNQQVIAKLEKGGHLTPVKLAALDEMTAEERQAHANEVVDTLEAAKEIKALYIIFKDMMSDARDFQPGRYKRGNRQ